MAADEYRIVIEPLPPEDGGGFVAYVPDLPGCMSDGATPADALRNVQEAITSWIECAKKWKQEIGYHRRSLAETQMFRVKTIFGDRVSARQFAGQATQVLVRCAALNTMTPLGMPDSYAV